MRSNWQHSTMGTPSRINSWFMTAFLGVAIACLLLVVSLLFEVTPIWRDLPAECPRIES